MQWFPAQDMKTTGNICASLVQEMILRFGGGLRASQGELTRSNKKPNIQFLFLMLVQSHFLLRTPDGRGQQNLT